MAREVRAFDVLVPAGTAQSAGFTSDLSFPPRIVTQIEVLVPPGPRGNVGFAIGSSGVPVMPHNSGAWIVSDDERIVWPLDNVWDSGSWTLFAYNSGQYNHTLFVTFLLDPATDTLTPATAPLAISTIVPQTISNEGDGLTLTLPTLPDLPALTIPSTATG